MMKYSEELIEYIKKIAKGRSNVEIIDLVSNKFGITLTKEQMKNLKANHHISSGLTGRFEKGHVPFNKDKKTGGWAPTYFKKGHIPHNARAIGTERIDTKDGYLFIKVAEPNVWKAKHVLLWEKHHGKVPKGNKIIFLDGDKTNIKIENLAMVTYAQMLIINKNNLIKDDPKLTETGLLISKVIEKTFQRRKES